MWYVFRVRIYGNYLDGRLARVYRRLRHRLWFERLWLLRLFAMLIVSFLR